MNFKLAELDSVLVPRAAKAKYHKLGDIKTRNLFSHVSGAQKLKIKVSQSHAPCESSRGEFFLVLSSLR